MKTQHTNEAERVRRWTVDTPGQWLLPLLFSVALALLVTTGSPVARAADSPHWIPFQGHLTRPSAADPGQFEPVPAGRYDILFTIYTAPIGGETKVWGPERQAQLPVINGLVNAILGSVTGFNEVLANDPNFFARTLYVGITVDADGNPNTADLELVPRQTLLPAVYALGARRADLLDGRDWRDFFLGTDASGGFTPGVTKARDADKLDGFDWGNMFGGNGSPTNTILSERIADQSITGQKLALGSISQANLSPNLVVHSIIPPGTISAFAGSPANLPPGWLLCDGSPVKTNLYPNLFAAIGMNWGVGVAGTFDDFSLPDLRGMFLRGVNDGLADATWKDPEASARLSRNGGNSGDAVGSFQTDQFQLHRHDIPTESSGSLDEPCVAANIGSESLSSNTVRDAGGAETRPNNAAVTYIIKY